MRFALSIGIASLLPLASCGPATRSIAFTVADAKSGAPVASAHVRAVPLDQGVVPLPLSEKTLDELLAAGKTDQQGFTDADGRVSLMLLEGAPYLITAHAQPFAPLDLGYGGDERGLTCWELRSDHRTLEAWDDAAGVPIERRALRLRVAP